MQHKCIIVQRGSEFGTDIDKTDPQVTNLWKWTWMQHVVREQKLGDTIRKIQKPGQAMCILCNKELKYGKRVKSVTVSSKTQMKLEQFKRAQEDLNKHCEKKPEKSLVR